MAVAYQSAFSRVQGVEPSQGLDAPPVCAQTLAPLLEGARARGVADAFEMAGQAAILLGGAGDVLHMGRGAQARCRAEPSPQGRNDLSQEIRQRSCSGHALRPRSPGRTRGIREAMTLSADGGGSMRVRIVPHFEGGHANPAQLLKAVVHPGAGTFKLELIKLTGPAHANNPRGRRVDSAGQELFSAFRGPGLAFSGLTDADSIGRHRLLHGRRSNVRASSAPRAEHQTFDTLPDHHDYQASDRSGS
jgi:hypothetical protein